MKDKTYKIFFWSVIVFTITDVVLFSLTPYPHSFWEKIIPGSGFYLIIKYLFF
jgi:hypothetical protein